MTRLAASYVGQRSIAGNARTDPFCHRPGGRRTHNRPSERTAVPVRRASRICRDPAGNEVLMSRKYGAAAARFDRKSSIARISRTDRLCWLANQSRLREAARYCAW